MNSKERRYIIEKWNKKLDEKNKDKIKSKIAAEERINFMLKQKMLEKSIQDKDKHNNHRKDSGHERIDIQKEKNESKYS